MPNTPTNHRAPLVIVLGAMREHDNVWFSRDELRYLTGRSWKLVNRALNALHRRGYVQHSGTGHYRMTPAGEQLLATILEPQP